jgi:hypothetical protein
MGSISENSLPLSKEASSWSHIYLCDREPRAMMMIFSRCCDDSKCDIDNVYETITGSSNRFLDHVTIMSQLMLHDADPAGKI